MSPAIAYFFPSSFLCFIEVNEIFDSMIVRIARNGDIINDVNNMLSALTSRKKNK